MKIAKTASLPLDVIRGTLKERHTKMLAIADEIFEKIVEKPNDLSLNRLQQITQDTLTKTAGDGRKINIQIKDYVTQGACEGKEGYLEKDGIIEGFEILIPTKKGALKPSHLPVFMHELVHALYQLVNPKVLALESTANITRKQIHRATNFYENTLYTGELFDWFNPISTKIKQSIALRGIDDKEKIKILQDCKHSLISEFNAYWEGERFSCKAATHGINTNYTTDYDCIMFDEKIEYLEKEIVKLIKKVRKNNK
ncbi:hypothetical protein J6A64_09285 [bacterium]|nr:hypothetical protein [bacterium]